MSLEDFLDYDSSNRSFLSNVTNNPKSLDELSEILCGADIEKLGLTEEDLALEFYEIVKMRVVSSLMPESALTSEGLIKPHIKKHLDELGVEYTDHVVDALKYYADNFKDKLLNNRRKFSISDVRTKYKSIFDKILSDQNGRCAVCGVELKYGHNMELDHIFPWHLGNDPTTGSNWQFLCKECNMGKGEWPYYSINFSRIAWLHTKVEFKLSKAMKYAALTRDKCCYYTSKGPKDCELHVVKKVKTGNYILDNLMTVSKDYV